MRVSRRRGIFTMNERSRPNILITGTPGCGKTSLSAEVSSQTGFQHIIVGDWVKDKSLHSGWEEEYQCYILDDDKVRGLMMTIKAATAMLSA